VKENAVLLRAQKFLQEQKVLIEQEWLEDEAFIMRQLQLLTFKPRLYLLNGKPEEVSESVTQALKNYLILDIASEEQSEGLNASERVDLGFNELSGTDLLIKKSYDLLGLQTFLTTGEIETRAWTIKKGDKAPQAAGVIHSDFEKKFVKAEVVFWEDLLKAGSYAKAREMGLIRTEGKEYVVKDGDVIEFKHG
jgi:ribosome-binding ATPase YchF (GTP1/OBG family)